MPTVIFSIIPDVFVRAPGDNDIYLRTFANTSQVSELIRLVEDENIVLSPAFENVSTFGNHRLTEGDEFEITLNVAFTNTSTFGPDTELTEAPPDEVILLSVFNNVSTFGPDTELTVAPADGIIRLTSFNNVTTFGAATFMVTAEDGEPDYDEIAESQIAETMDRG